MRLDHYLVTPQLEVPSEMTEGNAKSTSLIVVVESIHLVTYLVKTHLTDPKVSLSEGTVYTTQYD